MINNDDVKQVLTMEMTMDALEQAYSEHVAKEAVCRPRIDIRIPTQDPQKLYCWGSMEGGSVSGYFAIRMKSDILYQQEYNGAVTEEKFCIEPGTFCGLILLMSVNNGEPLAILNDGVIQQSRVGADGGLGVKYAAREDAEVVGMLGAGGQARSHLAAYMQARPNIKRIQVYSPTKANREQFAAEMHDLYGIEAVACNAPEEIYQGADIVAALTDSAVPVLDSRLIQKGQHIINVGGGNIPSHDVMDRIDVYLRFGNATAPWGLPEMALQDEYLTYSAEPQHLTAPKLRMHGKRGHGAVIPDRMVTLAQALENGGTARTSADQITYSERGNLQGQQFWAVAGRVYEEVKKRGLGHKLPTEWFTQDIRN
ncbi:MAG: ornithine cyclodeaminase family protein [Marinobacter sp.]|uniref:ornithine cyclodeaminase family protein n=1 Tax=Marinobacter sp. TaxID=50741 RepID=UPI0032975C62